MKSLRLIYVFLFFTSICYGQSDSDSTRTLAQLTTRGIATGLHINKYSFIELGYFKHTIYEFPMTTGESYSIETNLSKNTILAPKINYWINILFLNAGFSSLWYFDLYGNNSLKFRPEIGFGYKDFKINYSINLSLTNRNMDDIGTHFISINYYIGLKEK